MNEGSLVGLVSEGELWIGYLGMRGCVISRALVRDAGKPGEGYIRPAIVLMVVDRNTT